MLHPSRSPFRLVTLAVVCMLATALIVESAAARPPAPAAVASAADPAGLAPTAAALGQIPGQPDANLPTIRHVFIIINENEPESTSFPANGAPPAPYLGTTMRAAGAFVPNYYGIGHNSEDNYAAMVSGQSPNADTSGDCQQYGNFPAPVTSGAPYYQEEGAGCIYPSDIPTIVSQLTAAGLTWKSYNEDMGNAPSRESSHCGHPAVGATDNTQSQVDGDGYATRHNPFVYFHSIIDNASMCDSHVVNLNQLSTDLKSASTTPNYVFITPNLCHDGHDATCMTPGENGGYAGVNEFLTRWVPQITASPAYTQQNGLLITTWDESSPSDTGACCGEMAGPSDPLPGITGAGGGKVGAVLMSPCIAPGTVTMTAYNQYSQLGSVEDLFGLKHIGYAQLPNQSFFGSDIFTRPSCSAPPDVSLHLGTPTGASVDVAARSSVPGVTFTTAVRRILGAVPGPLRTLASDTTTPTLRFDGTPGGTYQFQVTATSPIGKTSQPVYRTVTLDTAPVPPGARLSAGWRTVRLAGAPSGTAVSAGPGSTYRFSYTGRGLAVLGLRDRAGGLLTVRFDGHTRTISVHAPRRISSTAVFIAPAGVGHHTLLIRVRSGRFMLEGLRILDLA